LSEETYYLQYLNDKGSYAKRIWNIVNWEMVEERVLASEEAVSGSLKGLRGGS
jgi:Fe-Mn family superoxide dismutase